MIITSLQRKGNNVLISFDEGEPVILDYRTVLDNGLRKNDPVEDKFYDKLIAESSFLKAKDSAFIFLGRRHHSISELRTKLIKKKFSKTIIERVLADLIQKGMLDDEQFALAYLEERSVKKKIGFHKLKAELFKKGIAKNLIDKVLLEVDQELSLEQAVELAQKKSLSLQRRGIDKKKIKSKIFSFLSSRGFESEIIMKVLSSHESDEEL